MVIQVYSFPQGKLKKTLRFFSESLSKCSLSLKLRQQKGLLLLADLLTQLPYTRWSSRIVDRALVLRDRGGES